MFSIDSIAQLNEIGTFIALIIGGLWVIYKFFTFRWHQQKINVSHNSNFIKKEDGKYIIRIGIDLENVGRVKVSPIKGYIILYNLDEVSIDKLSSKEWVNNGIAVKDIDIQDFEYVPNHIEPGESETAHTLITLDCCPSKMEFYSHIENQSFWVRKEKFYNKIKKLLSLSTDQNSYGWNKSSIINF